MAKIHPWLTTLALAALPGAALATGYKHEAGSETWTEAAGLRGSAQVDRLTLPDYFGLQAVKLWDFDRRACQLQIEQGSFNAPGVTVLDSVKVCEPKLTQSWKRAAIGAAQFVTGLSVCTEKGKEASPSVHGVELWGASLGGNGKLVPAKKSVRIEFAGCETWTKKISCPAGSIGTGVRAFTEADQGVVGMALRCHRIAATE